MAISIQLPTITQAIGDFYPMKIYSGEKDILPCDVMEIAESQDFGIANFPIDKNTYVGDNIYQNPINVSTRVFVRTPKLSDFLSKLKRAQFSLTGFKITGMDGQIYNNMRIESFSTSQTKDVLGGYFYGIHFKQMFVVSAFNGLRIVKNVKRDSYQKRTQIGEVNPSKQTKKSALKALLDGFSK